MKKLSFVVSLVLAFALSVWAQTPSSNDTQSGTGSSASQSSPSNSGSMGSQGSMSSPSTSTNSQTSGSQGSMGQGNTATAEQGKSGKEHKLKGCLESEGGSYMLREKNGKEIPLTGSADLSQYANHEVAVRGDWGTGSSATGSTAAASSNTSDMSKGGEKQFTVDKVDSLSDTCKGAKKADKDNKGASNNTNPSSPQ